MKKNYLYSAAVVATLALASCSSSDVIDVTDEAQVSGQVLEIAVENAGNGLESRGSDRPLNSSAADQNIDEVAVIITDADNKVVYNTVINNWNNADNSVSQPYSTNGHGRRSRLELPKGTLKAGATYTIYSVGYNSTSTYQMSNASAGNVTIKNALASYIKGTTFNANAVVLNGSNNAATEIFAGSATVSLSGSDKFTETVALHRQVAGIFSYIKNIPYMAKGTAVGTKLRLVASAKNQNFVLGQFYNKTLISNGNLGEGDKNVLQNVVNGQGFSDDEAVVYEINLDDWFGTIQDLNFDGLIDKDTYKYKNGDLEVNTENGNWAVPTSGSNSRYTSCQFAAGSVFGGEFIIPFTPNTDNYTFKLQLTNDDASVIFREWSISLPESNSGNYSYWNTTQWASGTFSETTSKYSVLRNHLYGIGKRNDGNNPTNPGGTDPENPTPTDPDVPQDLNTKQDIVLQVNDNWEVIHQMVVE